MGKIRRGNYIFIDWIGDHEPRHVHIYKDGKLVAKWDLQNNSVMKGRVSKRLRDIINELVSEGRL